MRKKPGLHLLRDSEFLSSAAFGLDLLGNGPPLGLDGMRNLVETDKRERVAVGILETGEDAAPNRRVLRGL